MSIATFSKDGLYLWYNNINQTATVVFWIKKVIEYIRAEQKKKISVAVTNEVMKLEFLNRMTALGATEVEIKRIKFTFLGE